MFVRVLKNLGGIGQMSSQVALVYQVAIFSVLKNLGGIGHVCSPLDLVYQEGIKLVSSLASGLYLHIAAVATVVFPFLQLSVVHWWREQFDLTANPSGSKLHFLSVPHSRAEALSSFEPMPFGIVAFVNAS